MNLNNKISFSSLERFTSLNKKDDKKPAQNPVFEKRVIDKIPNPFLPDNKDYLREYLKKGIKIIKNIPNVSFVKEQFDTKLNEVKLTKMFLDSGYSLRSIKESSEEIFKLAKFNYNEIEEKHFYYIKNIRPLTNSYRQKNLDWMEFSILDSEGINARDLDMMYKMAKNSLKKYNTRHESDIPMDISMQIDHIKDYENFDIETTAKQKDFIRTVAYRFDEEFINNLPDSDKFAQIPLISDIKRYFKKNFYKG